MTGRCFGTHPVQIFKTNVPGACNSEVLPGCAVVRGFEVLVVALFSLFCFQLGDPVVETQSIAQIVHLKDLNVIKCSILFINFP